MHIAYISLHWPRTLSTGVGKKIRRQIETWKTMEHEACFFMHTEDTHLPNLLPGEKFFYSPQKGVLQREFQRIHAAQSMLQVLKDYRPDLIYLRYGMYVYPLHRLRNIAPLVIEINTNDLEEHKRLGIMLYNYNRLTRHLLLNNADGFITVSEELNRSTRISSIQKPSAVIANGINLQGIKPVPPPNNDRPRAVFVGTPGYPWHGVDKLIKFARNYTDIQVDIVGYEKTKGNNCPKNVKFHGYLDKGEYIRILSQADLAISSLALHRNNMKEASPLKSREYLAYGLPLIMAYKDTDLEVMNCDFVLRIPNREDNVNTHGEAMYKFAYRVRGKRIDRDMIAPRIDSTWKEKRRLAFFEKIILSR